MQASIDEINEINSFIFEKSGIVLDHDKLYLLESRLEPIAEKQGLSSIHQLIQKAKFDKTVETKIIDAISTNETSFFRDGKPFDVLQNVIVPDILEKQNSLLVWSAASSTGQEAYSIAMTLKEILFDFSKYSVKILGTDISETAVQRANRGVYSRFELNRGLSAKQIERYFTQKESKAYQISDELRSIMLFTQGNLFEQPLFSGMYDIVFCRNVAIYFNDEDKLALFNRIHKSLKNNGYLIIGSTESISYASHLFKRESIRGATFYRKI